jgi:alpha-1,3-rhamnosyl/mannosyltransferase
MGLEQEVILTGWVSREELYQLFRQAGAFVYPSLFEGFGMPVLEALAAGIPTACSNIDPLRTLAGEAAALFDPEDEGAMAAALRRVVLNADARARLSEAGPAQASKFSWRQAARETMAALEEAADQRR